jgi:2,4-dienoyl-CoA reductase-like NADH-dependent reductase (Old Yellow Enzyme family)
VRISGRCGWPEGGWTLDDTVSLAKELVCPWRDVVDCSSAVFCPVPRQRHHRAILIVSTAERVKKEVGIKSMAVGLTRSPAREQILKKRRTRKRTKTPTTVTVGS